ncbi:BTAD domain-containing putative transcriptional regulator [Streptomyces griseomycini]|uniref:AfsR/SARP family transcriptional regulator n=1 Tax=Streptomyces griseomycini TaxID=66895 RepID=UPI00342BE508
MCRRRTASGRVRVSGTGSAWTGPWRTPLNFSCVGTREPEPRWCGVSEAGADVATGGDGARRPIGTVMGEAEDENRAGAALGPAKWVPAPRPRTDGSRPDGRGGGRIVAVALPCGRGRGPWPGRRRPRCPPHPAEGVRRRPRDGRERGVRPDGKAPGEPGPGGEGPGVGHPRRAAAFPVGRPGFRRVRLPCVLPCRSTVPAPLPPFLRHRTGTVPNRRRRCLLDRIPRRAAGPALGDNRSTTVRNRPCTDLQGTFHPQVGVRVSKLAAIHGGQWMTVKFGLLGTTEARIDGLLVEDLGHPRQRHVLAALLIGANRPVPAKQLIDRVWAGRPPQRALGTLYSCISRLRRALAPASRDVRIARQAGGYLLTVDPSAVDLHHFRRLVVRAGAAHRDERAADLLERALGLWRGEAFAAADTPWFNALRAVAHQERLAAELDLADIRLRRGDHARLLPELSARAQQHPLDERVAGQLMTALYRSGRAAEALDLYQAVRRRLADEPGIDPGPALRQLHQQVLTAAPVLATPAVRPATRSAPSPTPVPRQLPAPPLLFTGRTRELGLLDSPFGPSTGQAHSVVILAIGGVGGIGKTWLALHWAHENLERFPDGQLYVDLRGSTPLGEPVQPRTAVRGFLDALGADPATVPADPDAQAALYRGLTAGKRLLIVLDNARDTAQVAPLLPGSPTCTVIVTSRRRLAGLAVAHGARPLILDTLTDTEARRLLTRYLGTDRVAAEPEGVTALLDHCAGLPLAIGVLAARATTSPGVRLTELAAELHEEQTRGTSGTTGASAGRGAPP